MLDEDDRVHSIVRQVTRRRRRDRFTTGVKAALIVLGAASLPAAWLTHLYVCFVAAKWGFLIAGAVFFPVAVIHGYGIWFGLW
jgi:hypothetical protein